MDFKAKKQIEKLKKAGVNMNSVIDGSLSIFIPPLIDNIKNQFDSLGIIMTKKQIAIKLCKKMKDDYIKED